MTAKHSPELTERNGARHALHWIFLSGALLIFIGARLWRLTSHCLWFDEIFSIHAARHGWLEMFKFAAADFVHPPLFYALLKLWISAGGESVVWLRSFPVIFSVAALIPFWFLCRELSLKPTERNLALLLAAVSHYLITYAQEVRMYSPLWFFSVTSLWLFVRFMKAQTSSLKNLLALSAINLLLVYTHYYGWVLIATQALVLLLYRREKLRNFCLAAAGLALAYVPWIYALFAMRKQGQGVSNLAAWFPRPGLHLLKIHFVALSEPFLFSRPGTAHWLSQWLVLSLFGIPLILFCYQLFRARPRRPQDEWLLIFAFVPLIGAVALSWILPFPIWGSRHLIISVAPYFIVLALAILRLQTWVKTTVMLLLGGWIVLAAAVVAIVPAPKFTWCSWEQLAEQIPPTDRAPPSQIYAFEDLVAYHFWFAGTQTNRRFNVTAIKNVPGLKEDPAFFLPLRFDEVNVGDESRITGDHIWLAFRSRRWNEAVAPMSIVRQKGYTVEKVFSMSAQGEQSFLVELKRQP